MPAAASTTLTILRCTTGGSHKEYRIFVEVGQNGVAVLTTSYGRIGSANWNRGATIMGMGLTKYEAQRHTDRIIREKVRKGYEIVDIVRNGGQEQAAQTLSPADEQAVTDTITNAIA